MPVFVQQTVIHAPCVDAEAIQRPYVRPAEGEEALLELIVNIGKIPVADAVELYIVVFKAVQLPHGDALTVKLSEYGTAIAGPYVKCQ